MIFVISANIARYNLDIQKNVYYCLHNFDLTGHRFDPEKCLEVQVYTNEGEKADKKIDEVTFYEHRINTLSSNGGRTFSNLNSGHRWQETTGFSVCSELVL